MYNGFETLRGAPGPEEEGICRQREIPTHRLGLRSARKYHRRDHPTEPHPPRQPGAALASRHHLPSRPTTTTSCCSRRRRPRATTFSSIAVSLDPYAAQEADIEVPPPLGVGPQRRRHARRRGSDARLIASRGRARPSASASTLANSLLHLAPEPLACDAIAGTHAGSQVPACSQAWDRSTASLKPDRL